MIRFHDLIIYVDDDENVPLTVGASLDGRELIVPKGTTIELSADAEGVLVGRVPVFLKSVRTEVRDRLWFMPEPEREGQP